MKFGNAFESAAQAQHQFETCWSDPNATRFELPLIGVNDILREHYIMKPDVNLTRSMIWDMECKKALDPSTYVPYVVSDAGLSGRRRLSDGCEHFVRWSTQKAWLGEQRGRVLESIFIDHANQRIVFLGIAEMKSADGRTVAAADYQPLVHVEHAAGGSEHNPYNLWRIVFLTAMKDERYIQPFEKMAMTGLLPGYLEIYIRKDLKVELMRR
ncbi:hypothetical protein DFR50_13280 [Roseiarcus fermentans]|uniref:Uncharacterized protein n=1 Tax=Roseiarcus fermentans TaxID=1473586 RepID=A0A366EV96_9HYPH|nr:hypothetical protein [Roseiarcus fermentans]RBP06302.1 hypothetical protein DFR50_13280 [Roseiarcus fermentans]